MITHHSCYIHQSHIKHHACSVLILSRDCLGNHIPNPNIEPPSGDVLIPLDYGPTSSGMATSETLHVALREVPLLQLRLRWSLTIPDVPSSYQGSLSIFFAPPWGYVPVCLSLGTSFSFFVAPALFLLSRRASLLGQKGLFTVDILLCFGEDLDHACLRVL